LIAVYTSLTKSSPTVVSFAVYDWNPSPSPSGVDLKLSGLITVISLPSQDLSMLLKS